MTKFVKVNVKVLNKLIEQFDEQKDAKAKDVCKNFARKESIDLIQYYHEEAPHGSNYIHKSTCWNMRDLELLTKACKKSKCVFIIRNEHSVYVFSDY